MCIYVLMFLSICNGGVFINDLHNSLWPTTMSLQQLYSTINHGNQPCTQPTIKSKTKQYLPVMKLVSLLLTSRSVQAIQAIQNTCISFWAQNKIDGKT